MFKPKSSFKQYGSTFELVSYLHPTLIYERTSPGGLKQWEVWKLRRNSEGSMERYGEWFGPGEKSWGYYGWTFLSRERADQKQAELTQGSEQETS